ncbi:hypothetical protein ACFPRL_09095 [Pseudoclavibacter helvolus]
MFIDERSTRSTVRNPPGPPRRLRDGDRPIRSAPQTMSDPDHQRPRTPGTGHRAPSATEARSRLTRAATPRSSAGHSGRAARRTYGRTRQTRRRHTPHRR